MILMGKVIRPFSYPKKRSNISLKFIMLKSYPKKRSNISHKTIRPFTYHKNLKYIAHPTKFGEASNFINQQNYYAQKSP